MSDWWPLSEQATWWISIASVVMFVGSLAAVPWIVARIPHDYFTRDDAAISPWFDKRPEIRYAILVMKNLLGVVLIAAGLAMLVLPGQGVLTILFGVMLLDFPGKRAFELWLVRRKGVSQAVNWLRQKSNRRPLLLPDGEATESGVDDTNEKRPSGGEPDDRS